MDLQGSLIDTNLRIFPSNNFIHFLKSLPIDDNVPLNVLKFVKGKDYEPKQKVDLEDTKIIPIHLNSEDIENLNKIKANFVIEDDIEDATEIYSEIVQKDQTIESKIDSSINSSDNSNEDCDEDKKVTEMECDNRTKEGSGGKTEKSKEECNKKLKEDCDNEELYLITSDLDWLYSYLQKLKNIGDKNVPYLHVLLEGAQIKTPQNRIIKRNPILEARCVKLRAQQEAREYRKMTKSVDNVRMRFPEDSISFQLKQVNRHLIAIGQFIISIFAGFLFGFKGLEWMIGTLDFGFRLLLGVMCALIIALAEIYFLAKKLNEELNIPETVQLGGPPKFADQKLHYEQQLKNKAINKEHQD